MVKSTYKMRYLNPYPVSDNDKFKYYETDDEKSFNYMWQQCLIQNLDPQVIEE